jgi:hypothetical protein
MTIELAPVSHLLQSRCPTAIVGRVAALVVNAIKGQSGRALSHVSQKVFKTFPSFAHCNSSTAVIPVIRSVFIAAPIMHAQPCSIHGAVTWIFCCVAVFVVIAFSFEATAGARVPVTQISIGSGQFAAANASAEPMHFPFIFMGKPNDGQVSVTLTYDIRDLGHGDLPQGCWSSDGRALQGSAVAHGSIA